jgi:tetratricopeptide (TPR) repeat protein
MELFRKVTTEFPDTTAYGDAQYDIGLILHELKKYSEAIPEYEKIFTSQANDYQPEPESSESPKNFRFKSAMRISECYEELKDYTRALEYALLARDRYKFIGFCQLCLETVKNQLAARIVKLQELAKKAEPASK